MNADHTVMKRHIGQADRWVHHHRFGDVDDRAERMTRLVASITAFMMVVEIAAGRLFGSMALLADGWHMGTHMLALGISVFAYRFARRHRDNPSFSFGTGKIGSLAAFTSSIVLGIVALGMAGESISRLMTPVEVHFSQAFTVACIGLVVNLLSAGLLRSPDHGDGHHKHDHNLRAAFMHVVADALTSVLAMIALLGGRFWGLGWLDPAMGLLGAVLIAAWARGLLKESGRTLLDAGVDAGTMAQIKERLEGDADNCVADLHVWSLGGNDLGLAVSIVTHDPRPAAHYRELLSSFGRITHSTIEVIRCEEHHRE